MFSVLRRKQSKIHKASLKSGFLTEIRVKRARACVSKENEIDSCSICQLISLILKKNGSYSKSFGSDHGWRV